MSVSITKDTRLLFFLALIAIIISISFSFYKYLIQKDYVLYIQTECDPVTEECLVKDCDLEEDPRCPFTGEVFYKEIYKTVSEYRL